MAKKSQDIQKTATVQTGTELWAVIIGGNRFIEQAVKHCISISKSLWPKEPIRVIGLEQIKVEKIKKKLRKKSQKSLMKWINHKITTFSIVFLVTHSLIPSFLAAIGSVIPDAIEGHNYNSNR